MKVVIVRDSAYGNTAKVADAMAATLQLFGTVRSIALKNVKRSDLARVDLLIVGSPTQGGRATKLTDEFLNDLDTEIISTAAFAVFDTRFDPKTQKKSLQFLMKIIGFAAPKMAAVIKRRGGKLIAEPRGFIVNTTEGPLKKGELERAERWVKTVFESAKTVAKV